MIRSWKSGVSFDGSSSEETYAISAPREVWEKLGAVLREIDVPDAFCAETDGEEVDELARLICYPSNFDDPS